MVRCARKVQCGVDGTDDGHSYNLLIEGPINVASQLLAPRKGDVILAIVAWRTTKELTLLAFAPAPTDEESLTAFTAFPNEETQYYKATPGNLDWEKNI